MKATTMATRQLLAFTLALGCTAWAAAQIVVGQTTGLTGPIAPGAKENTEGAKLYIDAVNAKGGINGQKIELITLDDKFDPKIAVENARKLVNDHGAVAIFMNRGTPHSEAIAPSLSEWKVPLVAPSTGAMVLHQPVHRWIFNVRSTYQRESEKAVGLLQSIGISSIGVLHVDDSFGKDVLTGANAGFAATQLKPVFIASFDRAKPSFDAFVAKVRETSPQAVLIIGAAGAVTEAQKAMRASGSRAQVVTFSNNASAGFVKGLGDHASGTIITQVFPNERSIASPFVKEALALAKAKNIAEVSPAMLEGFAGAKVLVEGLRRAGSNPTGEKLRNGLESIRGYDIGGMDVSYSASDHTGLDFVDLSIINKAGKYTR